MSRTSLPSESSQESFVIGNLPLISLVPWFLGLIGIGILRVFFSDHFEFFWQLSPKVIIFFLLSGGGIIFSAFIAPKKKRWEESTWLDGVRSIVAGLMVIVGFFTVWLSLVWIFVCYCQEVS